MSEDLLFDVKDGVARITLNQPERRNPLTSGMQIGILDSMEQVVERDARCVVISGTGSAFCAGGDVDQMNEGDDTETAVYERAERLQHGMHEVIARVVECPVPTVAKIDGPAVGAGAALAIACDLQLVSARSKLGFVFSRVGLTVDSGTSYLLPRLVGENVAKELAFTGDIVDAKEAAELGFVNHVYPDDEFDECVQELVERIASGPTVALRQSKQLIGSGLDKSLDEALRDEANAQALVTTTVDHEEGKQVFLEDRDPKFEGN